MAFIARHSISVVFPAFNEAPNIERTVQQATACLQAMFRDWEIIVVNDGSRDATASILDQLARANPRVVALHHPANRGYGAALRTGIERASKDLVFFSDSDLQFHLSELVLLVAWIEQYDAVIGYRAPRRDPWHRRLNALGWNLVVRVACRVKARDVDCAFKLFRRSVLQMVDLSSEGAMVNAELLAKLSRLGFGIKQLPVTHFPRRAGAQTGASPRVIVKAFRELARLRPSLARTPRVVYGSERRARALPVAAERRKGDRRGAMLPINFADRRERIVRRPAAGDGLNVAMVLASPFPANHGTPAGVKEAAEAVAARGHKVHVVAYHFGEGEAPANVALHRIRDLGLPRRVVVGPTYDKPLLDLLLVARLVSVVRRERIDVIHAHNFEAALVAYVAGAITRRPVLYNAVCTMSDELASYGVLPAPLARRVAASLDRWVPRRADAVVCISEELSAAVRAAGVPAERVATIPLGISPGQFSARSDAKAARARLGLGEGPLAVYTGTLDRFQRIDYLLRAMRCVIERLPAARLVIAGGVTRDSDIAECRRLMGELGLERHVELRTGTTFADVPAFLAAADVAVAPRPACPGVPVKLLNYMAAGTPIVTFEGSAKGLVHGQSALLAPDHDWAALGSAMLALLDDPALAVRLGDAARAWAEVNLGWPALATRLEAVYRGLAKRPGPVLQAA
jgi:1,2-diacylglycerol 3-alpha-glucosyltransferase